MTLSEHEVLAYYSARVKKLHRNAGELRGPCPVHQGTDPNFSVNLSTGLAFCHSQCGKGFDPIALEQELFGYDFVKAKKSVFDIIGRAIPSGEENFVATYDYVDEHGELLYQVVRRHPKDFRQRRPAPDGSWLWSLGDVRKVPFRLPELLKAQFVFVVEGEKDVLAAERLGVVATCCSGGVAGYGSMSPEYFAGKDVAIIPDNDEPGREYAMNLAQQLHAAAKSVKILELPDLPAKGDLCDYIRSNGTLGGLRSIYKAAVTWQPGWQFGTQISSANVEFRHTFSGVVEAAGGLAKFFDLTRQTGMPTPWRRLTNCLGGGMRPGEVYVIGANQGAGKTSLAMQFVSHVIYKRKGVLAFSMEMSAESWFQRMASIEARVNLNELRSAQLVAKGLVPGGAEEDRATAGLRADDMQRAIFARARELADLPLTVSTKSSVTPEFLLEESRAIAERAPISLVVVDHMQLMGTTGRAKGDYEKFTAISRATKQVAVELGVPLLLVSQTSRNQAHERRSELEVSDLRGSGAIEEDAAAVFLLYPDKADSDMAMAEDGGLRFTRGPLKSWLKLGKNRYGEQGKLLQLTHYKTTTHFEEPGE